MKKFWVYSSLLVIILLLVACTNFDENYEKNGPIKEDQIDYNDTNDYEKIDQEIEEETEEAIEPPIQETIVLSEDLSQPYKIAVANTGGAIPLFQVRKALMRHYLK